MKNFLHNIVALLALASVALCGPAFAAATVISGPGLGYAPNLYYYGSVVGDFSTPYTNSTTTPTTLTAMSVSVPATKRPFALQYICARWSVDATKATATTGSVTLVVNGAADANTTRYTASGAGRNTISGQYCVQRSSAALQTVSLQGVSADTNALTVNAAYLEVWNVTIQATATNGL